MGLSILAVCVHTLVQAWIISLRVGLKASSRLSELAAHVTSKQHFELLNSDTVHYFLDAVGPRGPGFVHAPF